MNLEQLTDTVNKIFYNNSSSYKVIASKQKELLAILGANLNINKLTNEKINCYFEALINKQNEPATINSKMAYLSKVINYAYRTKLIQYKPLIPKRKIIAQKDKFITQDEYEKMLKYTKIKDLKELYWIIVIGYNTGIRISNILSILPEDIANDYIRIYHNKTNKPYSVPMNEAVKEVMQEFTGFTMNYKQVHYRFNLMIEELNLDKRITIHTLRHTTCSKLVEKGVPLPVVQALMNHSNIQTTMRYNHLKNSQLEFAVAML
jgi:integrase